MAVSKRDSARAQQVVDCLLALALQGVAEAEASRGYVLLALKLVIECFTMKRVNSEMQEFIDADVIMLAALWLTLEQSLGDVASATPWRAKARRQSTTCFFSSRI